MVRTAIDFYPRPPRGGRREQLGHVKIGNDFYPRPPRGGRLLKAVEALDVVAISIHALREEGDGRCASWRTYPQYFYPRPPRGGRPLGVRSRVDGVGFLSTPSARRATKLPGCNGQLHVVFLSTPSARRATAKTETKSLFSNKLYNILHEFRRALIYNGSKNYPNHAK